MDQLTAFNLMTSGKNVFLTGMAGTGKSYLLNKFISHCESNNIGIGITASTGIAATHIGGTTIHSWAGLGVHTEKSLSPEVLESIAKSPFIKNSISSTSILIIDEISMLHAYQLDGIDQICKSVKHNSKPFGGIQIILTGDFLQIPPVSRSNNIKYAFDARVWEEANLEICYLQDIYRQVDSTFIQILNEIRQGICNPKSFSTLEGCLNKKLLIDNPTELYPLNKDVDYINTQKLNSLPGAEKKYIMTAKGKDPLINFLKRSCITPEILILKEGAYVIFTKNNFEENYFNGTFGIVKSLTGTHVEVELTSGVVVSLTKASWEIKKFNASSKKYEVEASISQIPLKLAYAMTTHKSQGVTLEYAKINLANLFSYNMGYVALSRVKSLENLTLVNLDKSIYLVDPILLEKDNSFKNIK